MASLNKLTTEIVGSAKLISTQQRLGATPDRLARLTSSLAGSLCEMVAKLAESLDSEKATTLLELVHGTPFDDKQQLQISDAIEAKLLASRAVDKLGAAEKQTWGNRTRAVLNYFTKSDWGIFMNGDKPFNAHEKVMRAVARLASGGFVKPAPPVCADIIAMLAAAVCDQPVDEVLLYQEVHKLAQSFAGVPHEPGLADLPIIRSWPESPDDLPMTVKMAMYPDPQDQPVTMTLPAFPSMRKATSCRDTNKSVRDKIKKVPTPSQSLVPATPSVHVGAAAPPSFAANMGAFLQSAQALGLNPVQIAQMGAQLFAPNAPTAARAECGLKFFPPRASGEPAGGAGAATRDAEPASGGTPTTPDAHALARPSKGDAASAGAEDGNQQPSPGEAPLLPAKPAAVSAALDDLAAKGSLGRRQGKNADADAKALVASMETEHVKLLAKAKAKAESAKAESADDKGGAAERNGKKRKASPGAAPVAKRPAACASSNLRAPVPKMPKAGEGSVYYKGGKILNAPSRNGWRVWPNCDAVTIEKAVPYGTDQKASFKAATSLIDAYWAS